MAKAKYLVCRYCGDRCENANNRDQLSGWTHNHPAVCPYRTDHMPSLNGVHVGDVWRNRHTSEECTVTAIRLGGAGTYTDREPVVQFSERGTGGWPLWSLAEHWEPVTRPGEWPVPWTRKKGGRWAHDKWRGPAYRGSSSRRRGPVYWHAYHSVSEYSIEWERTNVLWQVDPEIEREEAEWRKAEEAWQKKMDQHMQDCLDLIAEAA